MYQFFLMIDESIKKRQAFVNNLNSPSNIILEKHFSIILANLSTLTDISQVPVFIENIFTLMNDLDLAWHDIFTALKKRLGASTDISIDDLKIILQRTKIISDD